jgi:hypothetical protein
MPNCWKCDRDLGPMLEYQKMVTEKGPICYTCFNALQEAAHQAEQTSRATDRTADEAS